MSILLRALYRLHRQAIAIYANVHPVMVIIHVNQPKLDEILTVSRLLQIVGKDLTHISNGDTFKMAAPRAFALPLRVIRAFKWMRERTHLARMAI